MSKKKTSDIKKVKMPEIDYEEIGRRYLDLIRQLGYKNLKTFADSTGIDVSRLYHLRSGKRNITLDLIITLVRKHYNTNIYRLLALDKEAVVFADYSAARAVRRKEKQVNFLVDKVVFQEFFEANKSKKRKKLSGEDMMAIARMKVLLMDVLNMKVEEAEAEEAEEAAVKGAIGDFLRKKQKKIKVSNP